MTTSYAFVDNMNEKKLKELHRILSENIRLIKHRNRLSWMYDVWTTGKKKVEERLLQLNAKKIELPPVGCTKCGSIWNRGMAQCHLCGNKSFEIIIL